MHLKRFNKPFLVDLSEGCKKKLYSFYKNVQKLIKYFLKTEQRVKVERVEASLDKD